MGVVQINGCDRLVDEDGFYLELTDIDESALLLLVGNPEDPTAGIDLTPAAARALATALYGWASTLPARPLGPMLNGISTRAQRLYRHFARIL
ncbi:hypothetical protein [Nocardia sp. alder85J]|uniref:hypothetical protein n=1 Tax=Nocardia sp. alder85J TaxID=2862949 RepID=UPI001CD6E71D|nr:hypothetical protein [Nocardia sp. alder85J]MCX4094529.1 hypothetical protein [Nocardia sp. alder85J]